MGEATTVRLMAETSSPARRIADNIIGQNTKHKNAKYKIQLPNAKYKMAETSHHLRWKTKYKIQNTKYKIQNTKYKIQNTK